MLIGRAAKNLSLRSGHTSERALKRHIQVAKSTFVTTLLARLCRCYTLSFVLTVRHRCGPGIELRYGAWQPHLDCWEVLSFARAVLSGKDHLA